MAKDKGTVHTKVELRGYSNDEEEKHWNEDVKWEAYLWLGEDLGYEFIADRALAELLINDSLFVYTRKWGPMFEPKDGDDGYRGDESGLTVDVNANDVFGWACAEGETINNTLELKELYDMCVKYDKYGSMFWACKNRGVRPQVAWQERLKKEDLYPAWMDDLKPSYEEGSQRELRGKQSSKDD